MSRAYRISVKESDRRVLKGSDHVKTRLEILEVLPQEAMAGLLAEELKSRGYEATDEGLVKSDGKITITIDPVTADVKVSSEIEREEEISVKQDGRYYDETPSAQRKQIEESLKQAAQKSIDNKAEEREQQLTEQATAQLEQALRDIQGEMDSVINRVTATALKEKAAQLGQIKEMTEDEETGSLTIVLEV